MADGRTPEMECVDPPVGERILGLSRPGLDPESRALLEAHLGVCAHCRQALDLDRRLEEGFRTSRGRVPRRTPVTWVRGAALAAAAAATFCMFGLPPRPDGPSISIRGADDPHFVRPVEGEIVRTGSLSARWTEVTGADAYEVRLREVDGTAAWTDSTTATRWSAGSDVRLVAGRKYRLVLSTVPKDLLAPGAASVRFTAGGTPAVIAYRAVRAQPIAYALIALALVLGIYSVTRKKRV